MNQFIASIFAAAITFSAVSAISATTTENADDASSIGTSETPQIKQQDRRVDKGAIETNTGSVNDPASNLGNSESPQIVEQNKRVDKGPAQNVTEGEYTKKSRLLKTKEKNAGTTKGNKVQPSQPEGAAPATK
ncbi:MAG: hypothetical protein V4552_07465 [Pseudomonadota bacterium]